MSNEVDYGIIGGNSRPQEGRSVELQAALDGLNSHELNKMNGILEEHYNKTHLTVLDKPLGTIIDETVNFFSNSFDVYFTKMIEAETILRLESSDSYLSKINLHLTAMILFIRDEETVLYLGIIFVTLAVLICFFNISRNYEYTGSSEKP